MLDMLPVGTADEVFEDVHNRVSMCGLGWHGVFVSVGRLMLKERGQRICVRQLSTASWIVADSYTGNKFAGPYKLKWQAYDELHRLKKSAES